MQHLPYLPHELVATQILLRLPVKSLFRFTCVCKAWRHLIIADDSFHRAHLNLQNQSLLISPQIEINQDGDTFNWNTQVKTIGLYRWEESRQDEATLVHAMSDSFFLYKEVVHDLAHCDGLILVVTNCEVRVINPATRRVLTIPHILKPRARLPTIFLANQAFGVGHDARSNSYIVARFFYKSFKSTSVAGNYAYTLGMQVYTLGLADQQQRHWRETSTPPPYPIIPGRTATFYKGSLFWTIDESVLGKSTAAPGFIRFSLEDEYFSVMPPPPCSQRIHYEASSLAELRGQLCLCVPQSAPHCQSFEIWMCHDLERWDLRHIIATVHVPSSVRFFRPMAAYADAIVLHAQRHLYRYDRKIQHCSLLSYITISNLKYGHTDAGTRFEYHPKKMYAFMVVPYIPSL